MAYSFAGKKEDFERFRRAGGGPGGPIAGGRSARRPGIVVKDDFQSSGNPSFDLARMGQREKRAFESRENALERRNRLDDTRLRGTIAGSNMRGVANINKTSAADVAGINRDARIEERELAERGLGERLGFQQGELMRRQRDEGARELYTKFGDPAMASSYARGEDFSTQPQLDTRGFDPAFSAYKPYEDESGNVTMYTGGGSAKSLGQMTEESRIIDQASQSPSNAQIADQVDDRLRREEERLRKKEARRKSLAGANRMIRGTTGEYRYQPAIIPSSGRISTLR